MRFFLYQVILKSSDFDLHIFKTHLVVLCLLYVLVEIAYIVFKALDLRLQSRHHLLRLGAYLGKLQMKTLLLPHGLLQVLL